MLLYIEKVAQPLEPGNQEVRVDRGGRPAHLQPAQATWQPLGGDCQVPPWQVYKYFHESVIGKSILLSGRLSLHLTLRYGNKGKKKSYIYNCALKS